ATKNEGTLTMTAGSTSTTCNGTRTFITYASTTFSSEADNGKYICYRAIDSAGNTSYKLSNAIAGIDRTAPTITIANPTTTAATSKTITATKNEGTLTMTAGSTSTTCNGTRTFITYASTTFSSEADNGKYVCYRAIDSAGNTSYKLSNAIAGIDRTAPTGTININGGATSTTNAVVTLTLSASDTNGLSQMQFSCNGTNRTTPETYSTSKFNFNITNQANAGCTTAVGTKTVYVKYKDNVGNRSTVVSDSINYIVSVCGNDIKEGTELCDGFDLQIPCTTALGKAGTKYCNSTCNGYTLCTADPTPPPTSTCIPKNCFIAGTKIKMADGTTKPIEEVTTNDLVYSISGEKNKVIGILKKNSEEALYAFNNSNHYFVTEAHPFLSLNGWKSLNPDATNKENPGLMVTKLSIGDILITEKGTTTLFAIDSIPNKQGTDIYNITVENTHDYYADGYAVHNKLYCVEPYPYACDGGIYCVANPNDCTECPVDLCGACTNTAQCPVNSYCHSTYNLCRPQSGPVCTLN
ncbi:MAG: hypothetical protein PHR61_04170, partial [Candidatus Absconditabacteria bacterium]|nr:hypothetical protein [Candidatus Absconditabacteria bacterium]